MNQISKSLALLFAGMLFTQTLFTQKLAWAKSYKQSNAYVTAIDIAKYKGHVYTIGQFFGTCDFDPGTGTASKASTGSFGTLNIYITKFDTLGNFVWVRTFASNMSTWAAKIAVDAKGNVYGCGRYVGTCDFDPGAGTYNLGSNMEEYYILKLNPAGNFVWAKSFGYSEQNETFSSLSIDPAGNVITTGTFNDSIDLDPGAARVVRISSGDPDGFVQKLDSNGNYIRGFTLGARYVSGITFDNQSVYLSGSFYDSSDFNPGPGKLVLKTNYSFAPYVLKLDHSFNFIWVKTFALEGGAGVIHMDNKGNLLVGGGFTKTADFDPGPGQYILTYAGISYNTDPFMLKLDSAGNFIWAKSMPTGSPGYYITNKTAMDIQGSFYLAGTYVGSVDFDPGPAVFNLKSNTKQSGFICKYDTEGNFLWAHSFGDTTSSNTVQITGIVPDEQLNVHACGSFNVPADFDPDTTKFRLTPITIYNFDAFFFKWRQSACSNLAIVADTSKNADCINKGRIRVHGLNGKSPYAYEWNTSPLNTTAAIGFSNNGIYTVTVRDRDKCLNKATFLAGGPDKITGFDLQGHLVTGEFRPGFKAIIRVDAYNALCTPVSGELKLVLNNLVKYDSASPAPSARRGDTLVWSFSNLDYTAGHLKPQVFVTISKSAKLGEFTCLDVLMTPAKNDVNAANNTRTYCVKIVSSFDPNDKHVFPEGACNAHYILKTDELIYTVRFQNTGSASAVNVVIEDTLDSKLDMASVQVIGKSHEKLVTEIIGGMKLRFSFDNIFLPDSGANFKGSQGYVIFKARQKPNLADGTKIRNTSYIYFDYNPAVITNTTYNTVTSVIPVENTTISKVDCDSFVLASRTYYKSGTYNARLFGSDGCDSLIKLNLTVKKSSLKIQKVSSCDSFAWNSQVYKTSGVYTRKLVNAAGCDSISQLDLHITNSTVGLMSSSACDSFRLNGKLYTASGIYMQKLQNHVGCDSTLMLSLDISKSTSEVITTSACDSFSLNGKVYKSGGVYTQKLANAAGCDSIITLNLSIHQSSAGSFNVSACRRYVFNSQVYTGSGVYPAGKLVNAAGCDSVVTMNLSITKVNTAVIQNNSILTAVEAGASYQWLDCSTGKPVQGATSQIFTATANGDYAVELTVNNCKDTSACYTVHPVSIADHELLQSVSIGPNPSDGHVTARFNGMSGPFELTVSDMTGRLLHKHSVNGIEELELQLGETAGLYFITVKHSAGIMVYKVVRE